MPLSAVNRSGEGRVVEPLSILPAHAKINLRLQVFERDEAGYHALETIFLRLSLHDTVEVGEEVTIEYLPLRSGEPGG